MEIRRIETPGYEEVWRAEQPRDRFLAFIAIHSLKRGPALGGVRLWSYPEEASALEDALRLARAMTFKAAVADLPHGGGKGVLVEPTGPYDRERLYRCFAEFIESLQGRYISAKDVGTRTEDLGLMRQITRYATGFPTEQGGAGDPSPLTAFGVQIGIQASVEEKLKTRSLKGIRVAIQGLGSVGRALAGYLAEEACELWGADLAAGPVIQLSGRLGLHPQMPELILSQEVDVFAPCALGPVLNGRNIPLLQAKVVAGAANEQLENEGSDPKRLQERGILYAPDFVINAGGLIHVAQEWAGYDEAAARSKAERIGDTLREVFALARERHITTHAAALSVAKSRMGYGVLLANCEISQLDT